MSTRPGFHNVVLLTGIPGVGKTTVIRKVVESLSDLNLAGFYTEEIRTGRVRQGFELVTLQGARFLMAHVDSDSPCRVGRYGVDVQAIDRAVGMALGEDRNADLFVVDEIGKMECLSGLFVRRMSSVLDSGRPVLATIALRGSGFIAAVKKLAGVELREITRENREGMPGRLSSWVRDGAIRGTWAGHE